MCVGFFPAFVKDIPNDLKAVVVYKYPIKK